MFGFEKKATPKADPDLKSVLEQLVRNEIPITLNKANGSVTGSRFGGKPATPDHFKWPRFEAKNYDGEIADRPLSFLCQINLEEIASFDKDSLLPHKGLLLFFYEQESACWGFDPKDHGCSRVFYFENTDQLALAELPEDLKEEYRVKEYALDFCANHSFPSFEELECHSDVDCDWDAYDEALEQTDYDMESERHKLLGYANLIQGEMLTECEQISREVYCGDVKSYQSLSDQEKADIKKAASNWVLLFQMTSIEDEDYELMFGDAGNLYFYIRKDDLKNKNFDNVHFSLQCF